MVAWAVVVALAVALSLTRAAGGLDARMADRHQPVAPLAEELLVVGIDSLATGEVVDQTTLGTDQVTAISADAVAAVVDTLSEQSAAAIVLDEPFVGPLEPRFRILRQAIARSGVVVGTWGVQEPQRRDGRTVGQTEVVDLFAREVAASGHDVVGDAGAGDGLPRAVPMLVDLEGPFAPGVRSPLPSVALAAVALARGTAEVDQQPGRVVLDDLVVPTGGYGSVRIAYAEQLTPGAFDRTADDALAGVAVDDATGIQAAADVAAATGLPYLSSADVLAGRHDPDLVAGRVVLVGTVIPGVLGARRLPGQSVASPPLYVTANAVNTLLTATFLEPVGAAEAVLWVLVLALLALLLARLAPPWLGVPAVALVAVGYLALTGVRFGQGVVLETVAPLVALVGAYLAVFGVRYLHESRQRRHIARLFGEYVPRAVAERLVEDVDQADAAASGERARVTVVFCDLRGFTSIAGRLSPSDVRDLLNVYYRHAAEVILGTRGTLMQYVGDEVFSVFGVPLTPDDDHAARAVACARELQAAADAMAAELDGMGIPPIQYGIGVHSGEVVAAHVGDHVRRQYAVVGDAVNVGARLCSIAGAGEVVVSSAVLDRLDVRPAVIDLGPVELKGVERDLAVFRLDLGAQDPVGT